MRCRGAIDDGGGHLVLDDVKDGHDQVRCLGDDGLAGLEVDLEHRGAGEAHQQRRQGVERLAEGHPAAQDIRSTACGA